MTQVFKALQNFELDGVPVRSGEEVVCRAREADKLLKEKVITTVDRELDPKSPKDAALIAKSDKRANDRHDGIKAKETAREEKAQEREAVKDEKRDERMAKLTTLVPDDAEFAAEFNKLPDEKQEEIITKLEADAEAKAAKKTTK